MAASRDKLENVTWYRDKTSPAFNNRNAFHLYFGEQGSRVWLRWRVQYYDDDWLFIRSFTVYVDGVPHEFSGSFERDHGSGNIWEWYDTSPGGRELSMIRSVISSKETVVRFHGQKYRADRKVTAAQKKALQRVLDAYAAKGGS